jgi:hypothetical protein
MPELAADYRRMREKVFSHPPLFDAMMDALRDVERAVNDRR